MSGWRNSRDRSSSNTVAPSSLCSARPPASLRSGPRTRTTAIGGMLTMLTKAIDAGVAQFSSVRRYRGVPWQPPTHMRTRRLAPPCAATLALGLADAKRPSSPSDRHSRRRPACKVAAGATDQAEASSGQPTGAPSTANCARVQASGFTLASARRSGGACWSCHAERIDWPPIRIEAEAGGRIGRERPQAVTVVAASQSGATQSTAISPARAKGGTSSRPSPLQKRPGSYQLAGRRLGSRPMCW
jgi:hypothetical protein